MKNISLIGSTGSIGTQSLEVIENSDNLRVVALTANRNVKLLAEQIRRFLPSYACIADESLYNELKSAVADLPVKISAGYEGLIEAATLEESDTVLTAIVGNAGLELTVAAIKSHKNIALANKETLVTAGEIIIPLCEEYGVSLLPVDSEHSAIFQCLNGENRGEISKIILTASGGPFYGKTIDELKSVTVADALNHPNWSMGSKITVDSSTLMNKGLEMIEAKWLFGVGIHNVEPVIHRQSIIHSAVEFVDGSVIAQMGIPDMRLPISYALNYPNRVVSVAKPMNIFEIGALTFDRPDMDTFRCLALAIKSAELGGTYPAAMNGANEAAVDLFLKGKIGFLQIADAVEGAMESHKAEEVTVDAILRADKMAREYVYSLNFNA